MSNHPLLKVEISQLSIAERIQLAEDLWDSIIDRQDEVECLHSKRNPKDWQDRLA
jgi:Putative addiction module component